MPSNVLAVFEGKKTEPKYFQALSEFYLEDAGEHLICAFENCIYDLWREIKSDTDLDVVELIRERSEDNRKILSSYRRSDIAQVYLFFDFDGHDSKYSVEKIKDLIEFFSNETESGAIFISYPMVEALKHFSDKFDFFEKKVEALKNIKYKNMVHEEGDYVYSNMGKISSLDLNKLFRHHIIKSNYLCEMLEGAPDAQTFSVDKIKYVDQGEIFDAQYHKFIKSESLISILSAFPMFLYQYFGDGIFEKLSDAENVKSAIIN